MPSLRHYPPPFPKKGEMQMRIKLPRIPIFLTDWVHTIPARFHCPILTKAYGTTGHDWLCPSCDFD